MRVLILGCGYVGTALGASLSGAGHNVFGVRRSREGEDELRKLGLTPLTADITSSADLNNLSGSFDWIINTVSSSRGGSAEYEKVYLEGTRNLLQWLERARPQRFVYTSSTSVYGQTDGSWVDEKSPTEPLSPTSQILLRTENLLNAAAQGGAPITILRVAGIYGPGRGHLFQQYLRGEARLSPKSGRFLNMIHRDDLVGAINAVLASDRPGPLYNATDHEPVTELAFYGWLSERLHRPMPPPVEPEINRVRKRGDTNKRISNRKLVEELGYQFKFPTFREGYSEEMRRLEIS